MRPHRFYRLVRRVVRRLVLLFFRVNVTGLENIPDPPYIIAANHQAWFDPAFKTRLLSDAGKAIAELGFLGTQGEHMVVVENTPKVHNMVVCTLCSCYPWPVLGLPPV